MTAPALQLRLDPPRRRDAGLLLVRGTPRRREAVRIRLHDGLGHAGLGEAVPLPGYSPDDAAGAEQALAAIAAEHAAAGLWVADPGARPLQPAGSDAAAGGGVVADWLDAALAPCERWLAGSVSARFALESALVDLLARRAGRSAAQWLAGARPARPVAVSLLLPDDDRQVVPAALQAVAAGFGVLKLKLARADRSEAQEDALLADLRAAVDAAATGLAAPVQLRLDANGALDPARVAARLAALRCHGVELVEEPVAGAALLALPALALPWAADESLADPGLAQALLDLPAPRRPAALVLKPALLGLARCLRLAEAAAARQVRGGGDAQHGRRHRPRPGLRAGRGAGRSALALRAGAACGAAAGGAGPALAAGADRSRPGCPRTRQEPHERAHRPGCSPDRRPPPALRPAPRPRSAMRCAAPRARHPATPHWSATPARSAGANSRRGSKALQRGCAPRWPRTARAARPVRGLPTPSRCGPTATTSSCCSPMPSPAFPCCRCTRHCPRPTRCAWPQRPARGG